MAADYFTAVRAFVRVVETGSFAKAADTLQFPRNTVTKLVQSLEAHLRVKLLYRTTRKVATTTEGAAYYERMAPLLEEWDAAENELSQSHASPRGRLRVDMGATTASLLAIPHLAQFRKRYPDMQLDISVSDRRVDLFDERIDCVVRAGTVSDPSLIARHLGYLPFITCASPAYLAEYGVPSHPSDLATGHTLVRYFLGGSSRLLPVVLESDGVAVEMTGSHFMSVNETNAMLAAGLAGLGIIHSPAFVAAPHVALGALAELLPAWHSAPVPIYIVYPANRHLSARTRVFVDWMAEVFRQSPHTLPPDYHQIRNSIA